MDPIQSIHYKDTTLALLWAAQTSARRCFISSRVDFLEVAMAKAQPLTVYRDAAVVSWRG